MDDFHKLFENVANLSNRAVDNFLQLHPVISAGLFIIFILLVALIGVGVALSIWGRKPKTGRDIARKLVEDGKRYSQRLARSERILRKAGWLLLILQTLASGISAAYSVGHPNLTKALGVIVLISTGILATSKPFEKSLSLKTRIWKLDSAIREADFGLNHHSADLNTISRALNAAITEASDPRTDTLAITNPKLDPRLTAIVSSLRSDPGGGGLDRNSIEAQMIRDRAETGGQVVSR